MTDLAFSHGLLHMEKNEVNQFSALSSVCPRQSMPTSDASTEHKSHAHASVVVSTRLRTCHSCNNIYSITCEMNSLHPHLVSP